MTQLNKITQIDPNTVIYIQSRVEMNPALIDEYAAMMANGIEFDPVEGVQDDSGEMIIWDGTHRTEAARKAGQLLAVRFRPGSRSEAEWLSLSANQKHGLRRGRADKRRVMRQALLHPKGAQLSNREIARHCGVDHKTVGRLRNEMELSGGILQITERTVTRNGTSYQIETKTLNQAATASPGHRLDKNRTNRALANTDAGVPDVPPNGSQQHPAAHGQRCSPRPPATSTYWKKRSPTPAPGVENDGCGASTAASAGVSAAARIGPPRPRFSTM